MLSFLLGTATSARGDDVSGTGRDLYHRCSACHLPSGEGIPSAFPPLKNRLPRLAATDSGRTYVVMVVNRGLMGPIQVDDLGYQGVMPAQPLNAAEIAEVLNFIADNLGKTPERWKPFTTGEVAGILSKQGALSPREVVALRASALRSNRP